MHPLSALLCVMVFAVPMQAQKGKGKCSALPADSIGMIAGGAYRDCDVDRPAKLRGSEPRITFQPLTSGVPRSRCYAAEFQFVVDTLGAIEMHTVHPHVANDRDLEDAVVPLLPRLKYEPAQLDDRPVRQIVIYRRVVGVVVRLVSSRSGSGGASPGGPPPSRAPRC